MFNGNSIGTGIQLGQGLVFRDPALIDFIAKHWLTRLIEEFDTYVPTQTFEGRRWITAIHHLRCVCPILEIGIVRDAALQGDRIVLGAPEALAHDRVTSFLVFDGGGSPLQASY